MSRIDRYERRWRAVQADADSTFVQPDEFLKLLLSRRVLVRTDDPSGNYRGLTDVQTGKQFLVERESLLQR